MNATGTAGRRRVGVAAVCGSGLDRRLRPAWQLDDLGEDADLDHRVVDVGLLHVQDVLRGRVHGHEEVTRCPPLLGARGGS